MACNLKTTKLLDCALIGVCAVTGLNIVLVNLPDNLLPVCFSSQVLVLQ